MCLCERKNLYMCVYGCACTFFLEFRLGHLVKNSELPTRGERGVVGTRKIISRFEIDFLFLFGIMINVCFTGYKISFFVASKILVI